MNWFIREKIFTYFYNKFRPVNRMHYIKYDVNSSLLTYFWMLQNVFGTLNHCFITTHIIHNEGDTLQIYVCAIFRKSKEQRTAPLHIWHTYKLYTFFGREKNTHGSGGLLKISLASVGYGDSRVGKHLLAAALGLPTNLGVERSWLFPASSIKSLTRRSLKFRWVYLAPHEDNSIQLLSTVRSRRWKNNFVVHLKVRRHIE